MKNKTGKRILLAGMLCFLSFSACACREGKETPEPEEQQEDLRDPAAEQNEELEPEQTADAGEGPSGAAGSDSEGSGMPAEWTDSDYDLEGNIEDLKDGQFTVVEVITEDLDGGVVMVGPADGDDSGFNKVSVSYDEDTLFALQTIYEGGARTEMSGADAADLESGQLVQIWGTFSEDSLKADQICMIKVE